MRWGLRLLRLRRVIEKKLARTKPDDLGVPDILLLLADEVVIDNLAGRIYLIVYAEQP